MTDNFILYGMSKCLKIIRIFYRLSLSDKFLLIKVGALIIFLRIALSFIPLNKLFPFFKNIKSRPGRNYKDHQDYVNRIIWAVEITGKFLLKKKCLAQALAVHILLNKKNINNDIQIGFIRICDTYSAHAWIKSEDKILIGNYNNLHLYFNIPLVEANFI